MGGVREVRVPDIGDFSDVPVIEVIVKPGDRVKPEDALIVLESDKATLEVPAPFGGAVTKLKVQVGDRVSEGTAILELEAEEVAAAAVPVAEMPPAEPLSEIVPAPIERPAPRAATPPSLPHASPAIRRFARELGVDLEQVAGSGPAQRILKDDIQLFVRTALAGADAGRAAGTGTPPHQATHFDEADVTELEALCAETAAATAGSSVAVMLTAFVLKAVAAALKTFPELNATFGGEGVGQQAGCHRGPMPEASVGRMVPVILDVDQKGVVELAREFGDLAAQAKDGRLDAVNLCAAFGLVSLAEAGGAGFTPMLQAPAVALLGITRPRPQVVERAGKATTRQLLPLCLSYDSRVIDAGTAARFTGFLSTLLADLRRVSL